MPTEPIEMSIKTSLFAAVTIAAFSLAGCAATPIAQAELAAPEAAAISTFELYATSKIPEASTLVSDRATLAAAVGGGGGEGGSGTHVG